MITTILAFISAIAFTILGTKQVQKAKAASPETTKAVANNKKTKMNGYAFIMLGVSFAMYALSTLLK